MLPFPRVGSGERMSRVWSLFLIWSWKLLLAKVTCFQMEVLKASSSFAVPFAFCHSNRRCSAERCSVRQLVSRSPSCPTMNLSNDISLCHLSSHSKIRPILNNTTIKFLLHLVSKSFYFLHHTHLVLLSSHPSRADF